MKETASINRISGKDGLNTCEKAITNQAVGSLDHILVKIIMKNWMKRGREKLLIMNVNGAESQPLNRG